MVAVTAMFPGVLLTVAIAWGASFLAGVVPLGTVVLAILTGVCVGNFLRPGARFDAGIRFAEKRLLETAILLLGVELDARLLQGLGAAAVGYVLCAVGVSIGAMWLVGRAMGLSPSFSLLLGIGNGVCGASAVAGAAPLVNASESETGLSIAIVNFLGTVGMFLVPVLGLHLLHATHVESGVLIGGTLQAVGQVTAAGFGVGDDTGQVATVVKMGRVLLLVPLLAFLAWRAGRGGNAAAPNKRLPVPFFIFGFTAMAILANLRVLPDGWILSLGHWGKVLLAVAMAGVGLRITFASILKQGPKGLAAASVGFAVQIAFGVLFIWLVWR